MRVIHVLIPLLGRAATTTTKAPHLHPAAAFDPPGLLTIELLSLLPAHMIMTIVSSSNNSVDAIVTEEKNEIDSSCPISIPILLSLHPHPHLRRPHLDLGYSQSKSSHNTRIRTLRPSTRGSWLSSVADSHTNNNNNNSSPGAGGVGRIRRRRAGTILIGGRLVLVVALAALVAKTGWYAPRRLCWASSVPGRNTKPARKPFQLVPYCSHNINVGRLDPVTELDHSYICVHRPSHIAQG